MPYTDNKALVLTTNTRWDSAAVGARTGLIKHVVPDGAVLALITTNKPIHVACTGDANVYDADAVTASQYDGIILGINEGAVQYDSNRPVHQVPVAAGQTLHFRAISAAATIHVTFVQG